ncbi:immunoglobulin superfamily member 5 [Scomber japonicus]|uniref:immunoglobulin superfamily member 5 n=1 Tax=Scomber japonicus TaxID=13676 RepID=UPI0023051CE9|nr:immunoglobulin superfamily member 5 [Scomber japonicus]
MFQLEPLNVSVLQGSAAQFNATVEGKWDFMTWTIGGLLVLTVPETKNETSSGQFSATHSSDGDSSLVEFKIWNTTRNQTGDVICAVQGPYGSKTATLKVQDMGDVNITEGNVTVEQGQQVELQCVTTAWFPKPTVTWNQNDQPVDSSLYNTTTSEEIEGYYNSTSVLKFQATSNTKVECLAIITALKYPQSSTVHVVVVPKPPDWTVLIAVVCSIGGFALLVLLILGIIFCIKHRKKKQANYQDEMRRVRTHSQLSGTGPDGQRQGQVNSGYVNDNQVTSTSVPPSEIADSGFFQTNGSNMEEMPNGNSNHAGIDYNHANHTLEHPGVKKHRHATVV